jgi:hypothetical protein
MLNLDNQIKVCPDCKGWGEILGQEGAPCPKCDGKGVFIQEGNEMLSFDLPTFVDFGRRNKAKYLRIIATAGILILGISSILTLVFVILQLF